VGPVGVDEENLPDADLLVDARLRHAFRERGGDHVSPFGMLEFRLLEKKHNDPTFQRYEGDLESLVGIFPTGPSGGLRLATLISCP
jgi:hypothetical protein